MQPPHIKSVEEISTRVNQRQPYHCLPKSSSIFKGKQVLWEVKKVLQCHFRDLYDRLNALTDTRERKCYSPAELVLGGIVLFLLKQKSRHEMDQHFREQEFSDNYRKIFKLRCPSMCAVEDFYRILPTEELEVYHTAKFLYCICVAKVQKILEITKYYRTNIFVFNCYSNIIENYWKMKEKYQSPVHTAMNAEFQSIAR